MKRMILRIRWMSFVFLMMPFGLGVEKTGQIPKISEAALMMPKASQSLLLDVTRVGSTLAAVGERGHILVSTDSGENWVQAHVPSHVTLTGVSFVNDKTGWAVGHNETILKTTDGGLNWTLVQQNLDKDPFLDVWFENEQHGIITGAYGVLYVTYDGGKNWEERFVNEEDDMHLNQIASSPSGKLYIAAEMGMAYKSTDNGETWQAMNMPYEGSFFGVLPLKSERVLMFGLRGHVFLSEDFGESWEEIQSKTNTLLNCGLETENGAVLIGGMGGTYLKSSDNGKTFSLNKHDSQRGISSMTEVTPDRVLYVGEKGMHPISASHQ
ncbi:MAG: hypothetical protein CSA81_12780 [Acidobacteria bacterium]|nr:MAG: hypothetical protein CSA81_12780 [Acidobacteriota bacterium]